MEFRCASCRKTNVIDNDKEEVVRCFYCNTPNKLTFKKVDEVRCPKCGSTQITASKKGFSGGNALLGGLLTGGIGLLAGTIGSNDIKITCLNCGKVFDPPNKKLW